MTHLGVWADPGDSDINTQIVSESQTMCNGSLSESSIFHRVQAHLCCKIKCQNISGWIRPYQNPQGWRNVFCQNPQGCNQWPIAIYCPTLFCIGNYKTLLFNNERTVYDIIFIFGICTICATVNLLKKSFDLELTLTL